MKELLGVANPRLKSRFLLVTLARTAIGVLDLAAIALVWYAVSGLTTGEFQAVRIGSNQLIAAASMNEVGVASLGLAIVALFTLKGFMAVISLKQLTLIGVDFESAATRAIISKALSETDLHSKSANDSVSAVHAIESGSLWARGTVLGYSVGISEGLLVLALLVSMIVMNPAIALLIGFVLGGTGIVLTRQLTSRIRKNSKKQIQSSQRTKEELTASMAVQTQLHLRGLLVDWKLGIERNAAATAKGAADVYFLTSIPRYIMEIAVLVSVSLVVLASFLIGDFADNAPGAAVILASAFRLSGALLPLQGAINLFASATQLGQDYFSYVQQKPKTLPVSLDLQAELNGAIEIFLESRPAKTMVLIGRSGLGKTTSLTHALLKKRGSSKFPQLFGFGGQRPVLLPGGLRRNLSLHYKEIPEDSDNGLDSLITALNMSTVISRLDEFQENEQEGLSGGELSRLEILRAHYGAPDLIILDEPTSGLDKTLVSSLASYINESTAKYIIISHDARFIDQLKDKWSVNL